jgi:hypothetical protein
VCSLSWAEEVFYRRLMSVADDHGRFHALPKLLRAACYPLQIDKVSDSDIGKWTTACVAAGLVRVYPALDGKRYVEIVKFGQQVRSKSKFPEPVAVDVDQSQASDNSCKQENSTAHLDVSVSVSVSVSEDEGDNAAAPAGARPAYFDEFWSAYPNKTGKDAARKAFDKRSVTRALLDQMLAALALQKASRKWIADGGQFIPNPATWLNQGRWMDEGVSVSETDGAPIDPDSKSAVEAEGIAKGFGRWNELVEQWHVYKERVRGPAQPSLDLAALASMAAKRQGEPA